METALLDNSLIPTQAGLRSYAKKTFDEIFETDEECFIDTFVNGQFHEEYPDWSQVADSLSRNTLALLILPICKGLISSHPFKGEQLDKVMNFYSRVGEWHRSGLTDIADLTTALDDVRPMLAGWSDGQCLFKILDYGIRRRVGLSTLSLDTVYTELATTCS